MWGGLTVLSLPETIGFYSLMDTVAGRKERGKGLGVGKYWVQSQRGGKCVLKFPSSSSHRVFSLKEKCLKKSSVEVCSERGLWMEALKGTIGVYRNMAGQGGLSLSWQFPSEIAVHWLFIRLGVGKDFPYEACQVKTLCLPTISLERSHRFLVRS